MYRIRALALVSIVAASVACDPIQRRGPADERTAQELERLVRKWSDALLRDDATVLNRIMTDDYMITVFAGEGPGRAPDPAPAALPPGAGSGTRGCLAVSGDTRIESVSADDLNVRLFGDAAVVTGRATVRGRRGDRLSTSQFRFAQAWVKSRGRWQAVGEQSTTCLAQR